MDPQLVKEVHHAGGAVAVWPVDDETAVAWCKYCKHDAIFSNRPAEIGVALKVLRRGRKRRRRICGAHAAHLRCCGLRSSLTHPRMRSLRCSAAPSIWTTWAPDLSPPSALAPIGAGTAARRPASGTG